jgi:hypothetical protein
VTVTAGHPSHAAAAWAGLALAPTSWYAMHLAASALAPQECAGWPDLTPALAALAAALTAAGGALSYRFLLQAERGTDGDGTRRFAAWVGVASSLLFLFVIACQAAAGLLYTGCER